MYNWKLKSFFINLTVLWKFDHKPLTKEIKNRVFNSLKNFDVVSGLVIVQILYIVDYFRFS